MYNAKTGELGREVLNERSEFRNLRRYRKTGLEPVFL